MCRTRANYRPGNDTDTGTGHSAGGYTGGTGGSTGGGIGGGTGGDTGELQCLLVLGTAVSAVPAYSAKYLCNDSKCVAQPFVS